MFCHLRKLEGHQTRVFHGLPKLEGHEISVFCHLRKLESPKIRKKLPYRKLVSHEISIPDGLRELESHETLVFTLYPEAQRPAPRCFSELLNPWHPASARSLTSQERQKLSQAILQAPRLTHRPHFPHMPVPVRAQATNFRSRHRNFCGVLPYA